MTIPALDPKPVKYSSSSLRTFTGKIKKGSQKFRALLTRDDDFIGDAKVEAWKATLQIEHNTKAQVRNAFKLTSWKHFDAELRDKLLRLLTMKTTAMIKSGQQEHRLRLRTTVCSQMSSATSARAMCRRK